MIIGNCIAFNTRINSSGGGAASAFTKSQSFTVASVETLQRVVITKQPEMSSDYRDLRFVLNPNGTAAQKKYLPYWIESSDALGATIWVGFKTAPSISSTFYMIYGHPSVTSASSGYKTFDRAGYYFNNFSRGVEYDFINVLGGYDQLVAGDPNGEETWPAGWQNPDDPNHIGIIYKRQDTNLHAGNPTTRTAMRISTNGGLTWGNEFTIDDPDSSYNCTSSSSVLIPTTDPASRTFTTQTGLPWQVGDLGQARASDTQYFDFTVTSYNSGTGQLVVSSNNHVGAGTLSSWTISTRIGATNATITAVKMPNNVVRLIMLNSHVNYTISGNATPIRVGTKYSDDWGQTWSTWTQRGPDSWINVGGQAITMNNGYCVFSAHQNSGIDEGSGPIAEQTDYFFVTRDYGVTWSYIGVQLAGVQLDEAGMFQMKDTSTWEWIEDKVRVICRREDPDTHFHTFDLTITANSITNSTPVENGFYVDEQSRGTYTWADNRIWGAFGDVREQMVYSDDGGDTWNPVPFYSTDGSLYSSRRVYTIMFYLGNGKMTKVWTSNKLSGGADTYCNYWDTYLMALRPVSAATLTDSRPRPTYLNPGMRINGSLVAGYRTVSTTSVAIPTTHPTQVTMTVDSGLLYQVGDAITITRNILSGGQRMTGTVVSYSGTQLVFNTVTNTSTGTFADWTIDKTSNFLADQAFVSYWNRNGKSNPFRLQMRSKSPNFGSSFFGLKKDETRATAVIVITNAGSVGDTITIKWSKASPYAGLFTGIGKVATYTVQNGDNIQAVVNGLVASANSIGICPVAASDSTTLTLKAIRGENLNINGSSFTIATTGTVAGSSGTFAGGAQAEGTATLSNIIHFDSANNIVRIEQANDNHNQALTATKNSFVNYSITWDTALVTMTDGTTTRTKNAATGSGIPDWDGHILISLTTNAGAPQSYHECESLITKPLNDPTATSGSISSGSWSQSSNGSGVI